MDCLRKIPDVKLFRNRHEGVAGQSGVLAVDEASIGNTATGKSPGEPPAENYLRGFTGNPGWFCGLWTLMKGYGGASSLLRTRLRSEFPKTGKFTGKFTTRF